MKVMEKSKISDLVLAERSKLKEVEKINSDLLDSLILTQGKVRTIYKTKIKEVPKYVTKIQKIDSDCNISTGIKQLLNQNINNLPETSPIPATAYNKTSDIREIDLIFYLLKAVNQYNLTSLQCSSLITWHEKVNND